MNDWRAVTYCELSVDFEPSVDCTDKPISVPQVRVRKLTL